MAAAYTSEIEVKVAQLCPTLSDPIDYTVHGILQARILEWVALPFSRGSFQPGIEPRSPSLQVDSLPAETQGKPKNTGVGRSNWGLLHCKRILYQLSHQGRLHTEVHDNKHNKRETWFNGYAFQISILNKLHSWLCKTLVNQKPQLNRVGRSGERVSYPATNSRAYQQELRLLFFPGTDSANGKSWTSCLL